MRNIPTELLRALVAVVDLKGYTKAGERLGRTQPAVSLQLKRLQDLLGVALFEKRGDCTKLTEQGELVSNYARRMLALNDELVLKLTSRSPWGTLKIGLPNDYADHLLPRFLERRLEGPQRADFDIACDISENLLSGLRKQHFDLVIAMTADGPAEGAFMTWREPLVWTGKLASDYPPGRELPLIAYPEGCLYRRKMLSTLQQEGRPFKIVYTSPSLAGIRAAVASGYGVTALAERVAPPELRAQSPRSVLPPLADVTVGIYVRTGGATEDLQALAACFADLFLEPRSAVA